MSNCVLKSEACGGAKVLRFEKMILNKQALCFPNKEFKAPYSITVLSVFSRSTRSKAS